MPEHKTRTSRLLEAAPRTSEKKKDEKLPGMDNRHHIHTFILVFEESRRSRSSDDRGAWMSQENSCGDSDKTRNREHF